MQTQKVNSLSFCGIRKVIRAISPKEADIINRAFIKNKRNIPALIPVKDNSLVEIVSLYNGEKLVGIQHKYKDGSFMGTRTFADGTSVTYSASYIFTKLFGKKLFSGATVKGKGILCKFLPYDKPIHKNGNPVIPTLKEIKAFNKPENILSLIKKGELQIIKPRIATNNTETEILHDGFLQKV